MGAFYLLFSGPAFLIWNSDLRFRTWDTVRISQCLSLNILPHNWRQMTVFFLFLLSVFLDCVFHCWLMFFPCVMKGESQLYTLPSAAWLGSWGWDGNLAPWMMVMFGHYYEWFTYVQCGRWSWRESDGVGVSPLVHPRGWGLDLCLISAMIFWHDSVRLYIGIKALRLLRGIYF